MPSFEGQMFELFIPYISNFLTAMEIKYAEFKIKIEVIHLNHKLLQDYNNRGPS